MGFFDNIGKTISDASQGALQKGKDMAETAKINSMISDEEASIHKLYEQIGKKYYDSHKDSPNDEFKESFEFIKMAEAKIDDYKQKIRELKNVIVCTSCGAEVPDGSLFCAVCGAKVENQAPVADTAKHCPNCGAIVSGESRFCTACGTLVESVDNNVAQETVTVVESVEAEVVNAETVNAEAGFQEVVSENDSAM